MVTLRVRPGFTHGARKQYKGGDLLFVEEAEAALLLRDFGDKLERTTADGRPLESAETDSVPAVEVETAEPEAEAKGRPGGRRSRRSQEAG